MRAFPFERRHGLFLALITLTAAAGLAACRRADLPDRNSPEYAAVRAFYVGLSALQVGDDVRAEAKLKEATRLAPDEPASGADLGLLFMRQRRFDEAAENLEEARQPEILSEPFELRLAERDDATKAESIIFARAAAGPQPSPAAQAQ